MADTEVWISKDGKWADESESPELGVRFRSLRNGRWITRAAAFAEPSVGWIQCVPFEKKKGLVDGDTR